MEITNKEKKILLSANKNKKYFASKVWELLGGRIKAEVEKGRPLSSIVEEISCILEREVSYNAIKQKLYRERKDSMDVDTNDKKIIAVVNFKGGVGKSTIANILELPENDKKVVINLDIAQNVAAEKSNSSKTYNFSELQENYGAESIEDVVEASFEAGAKYVVLDTPGDIEEFLSIVPKVDFFIVPFTPGNRSVETTLQTIMAINEYLGALGMDRKDKWCIVLNKYQNEVSLAELDEVYNKAQEILGNRLACKTHLKFSQVVPTMEREKLSPEELAKKNLIAYGMFRKRAKDMNKSIVNSLMEA